MVCDSIKSSDHGDYGSKSIKVSLNSKRAFGIQIKGATNSFGQGKRRSTSSKCGHKPIIANKFAISGFLKQGKSIILSIVNPLFVSSSHVNGDDPNVFWPREFWCVDT